MPLIKCVHCNVVNDTESTGRFCNECGKKLPAATTFSTGAGQDFSDLPLSPGPANFPQDVDLPNLRDEERKQAARQVSGVLYAIAALYLICGSITSFLVPEAVGLQRMGLEETFVACLILGGICGLFVGLGLWARHMPIAAGLVGLAAFVGLVLLDIALAPDKAGTGLVIKVVIVFFLIRAVVAANKAK